MTIHVPIKQAKDRLSELTRAAARGERVVITSRGEPIADLVAHEKTGGVDFEAIDRWKKEKGIGALVTYVAPDFDDPLPDSFWFPQD